jgi:chromosome segregation ATPase
MTNSDRVGNLIRDLAKLDTERRRLQQQLSHSQNLTNVQIKNLENQRTRNDTDIEGNAKKLIDRLKLWKKDIQQGKAKGEPTQLSKQIRRSSDPELNAFFENVKLILEEFDKIGEVKEKVEERDKNRLYGERKKAEQFSDNTEKNIKSLRDEIDKLEKRRRNYGDENKRLEEDMKKLQKEKEKILEDIERVKADQKKLQQFKKERQGDKEKLEADKKSMEEKKALAKDSRQRADIQRALNQIEVNLRKLSDMLDRDIPFKERELNTFTKNLRKELEDLDRFRNDMKKIEQENKESVKKIDDKIKEANELVEKDKDRLGKLKEVHSDIEEMAQKIT